MKTLIQSMAERDDVLYSIADAVDIPPASLTHRLLVGVESGAKLVDHDDGLEDMEVVRASLRMPCLGTTLLLTISDLLY